MVNETQILDRGKREAGRGKRQAILGMVLGGVIAAASSIFTWLQLGHLSNQVQGGGRVNVEVLQDHEDRLTVDERSIRILKDIHAGTTQTLDRHWNKIRDIDIGLVLQIALSSHGADIARIIHGFQELAQHRLSPALVNTTTLPGSVARLEKLMKRMNHQLAIHQSEDVFKFETSHLIFSNGTLRIFVHVPAFRIGSRMKMLRYTPLPIPLPKSHSSEEVKYGLAQPERGLLAISPNEMMFQTFTESQWGDCKTQLGISYCQNNNMYDKRLKDSCLVALYKQDVETIGRKCKWSLLVDKDYGQQIGPTEFLLYQHKPETVKIWCPNERTTTAIFQGLRRVVAPP